MTIASNISKRRQSALEEGSADYLAKRAELVEIARSERVDADAARGALALLLRLKEGSAA